MDTTETKEDLTNKGVLQIMDPAHGDIKQIWDPTKPDEVAAARETFNNLRKKNYLAFRVVGKDGDKGEQIREFDPSAGAYIMAPQLVGG